MYSDCNRHIMCIEYYFVRKEVMSHIPFNALSRRWVNSCLLMTWDSFQPNQAAADAAVQSHERCCTELKAQMSANMLKLNDGKTEAIPCRSKNQQSIVSVNSICVGESELSLCSLVIDLGLLIDSNITLHHVSVVVRTCYFHLHTVGKPTIPD